MQTDTCGIRTQAGRPQAGRRLNHSAKVSLARAPWAAERIPVPANPPSQNKRLRDVICWFVSKAGSQRRPPKHLWHAIRTPAGRPALLTLRFTASRMRAGAIPLHNVPRTLSACFTVGLRFPVCSPAVQHKRHRGDSNPRGQGPMDFESISLTARTQCQIHLRHGCKNQPACGRRSPTPNLV